MKFRVIMIFDKLNKTNNQLPQFTIVGSTCISLKCNKEIDGKCTYKAQCKYQTKPKIVDGKMNESCMLSK